MSTPFTSRLAAITVAAALALSACGDDTPVSSPASAGDSPAGATDTADPDPQSPSAPGRVEEIAATSGSTPLGDVLVGADGRTLYGFTNDTEASSTCYGTCADAWPPVIVGEDWDVAPDLDAGIFATTTRDDGSLQLVAGAWPLYWFAGDAVPGDVNGQQSGDVWFAAAPDGSLIRDAAPAESPGATDETADAGPAVVSTAATDLGDILVDADGLSLYGFTNDTDGDPTCEGDCADAWPPALVDSADLPAGLDDAVFSVVERPDGTFQLKAGAWPLYRFAGDSAPGDINGQGSGDVWFLATPDGGLVRDAAATAAPAPTSGESMY